MFHQGGKSYIESDWKKIHHHQKRDRNQSTGIDIYKFKLKMANTLSVMTNALRNVVSKQRIRYKEKGFNLDLAYICDNIIAMGYPADNIESIYRNRLEDVYKFLEENHPDHYKIYNLCLERSYDINKFHGRVSVYPFEDHNPPSIELILKFCNDVDSWLKADNINVAAVHCKAGKGRTGTMICCYLLYSRQQRTADEALACYDEKRTKDRKGVTIPSQRRYVQYFAKLIQSGLPYEKRTLQFCEIRFTEANLLQNHGTVHCSISVLQDTCSAVKVQLLHNLSIDFRKSFTLDLRNSSLFVSGDIKVELTHKTPRKKIFHFWFNTFFVSDTAVLENEGDDAKLVYTLNKCEIDDAHKDKEHKSFSEDFKVQLVFYAESAGVINNSNVNNILNHHTITQTTRHSQNNYSFHQSSNSGSDLNCICDQKSSTSTSTTTLFGTGCENVVVVDSKERLNALEANAQSSYNHNTADSISFRERERTIKPGVIALPMPMPNLSPQASYVQFNEVGDNHQYQLRSKNLSSEHQEQFGRISVTATSTPIQKKLQKAMSTIGQRQLQRQQQYQPSVSAPKVSKCTNSSTSSQSPIQANAINNTCNSSKSSSISSHSSLSVTGDNEEDWESANTHIFIPTGTETTPVTLSTPVKLASYVCDAENYVLLPSAKELQSRSYLCENQRIASNGITASTKGIYSHAHVDVDIDAPTRIIPHQPEIVTTASGVVLMRQQSNVPLSTARGGVRTLAILSRSIAPRPRRETT